MLKTLVSRHWTKQWLWSQKSDNINFHPSETRIFHFWMWNVSVVGIEMEQKDLFPGKVLFQKQKFPLLAAVGQLEKGTTWSHFIVQMLELVSSHQSISYFIWKTNLYQNTVLVALIEPFSF